MSDHDWNINICHVRRPKDFGSHPPDPANYASSQKEVARASRLRCSESVRWLGEFREKVTASYKENHEITLPFTTSRFAIPKSTQFPPAILRDQRQRLKYSRLRDRESAYFFSSISRTCLSVLPTFSTVYFSALCHTAWPALPVIVSALLSASVQYASAEISCAKASTVQRHSGMYFQLRGFPSASHLREVASRSLRVSSRFASATHST